MARLNVIGFEITEGISKKDGKPYSIGKLYAILPLSAQQKEGNVSKGAMGTEYRVEVPLLRKLQHLQPPLIVEAETADVMRFGERVQDIVGLVPVDRTPAADVGKSVARAA
jgi:hypothetical protein